MEHEALYQRLRLHEPWNSPHNQQVYKEQDTPSIFRCPSATDDEQLTNYVMVVGPGAISDGPNSVRIEDLKDGTRNTIMVVETTDCGIQWAEPRDLEFQAVSFDIWDSETSEIRSNHPTVVNALFADGTVHSINKEEIEPELLKALITIAGGEEVSEFWEDY